MKTPEVIVITYPTRGWALDLVQECVDHCILVRCVNMRSTLVSTRKETKVVEDIAEVPVCWIVVNQSLIDTLTEALNGE